MPEHLKALVVVSVLGLGVFALASQSLQRMGVAREIVALRRNAWCVVTVTAFLSPNFWVFMILAGVIAFFCASRDSNPVAMYFTLFFAGPAFEHLLPGFGLVESLFSIGFHRLLNLTILLPCALAISRRGRRDLPKWGVLDFLVCFFLLWLVLMHARQETITMVIRTLFYLWVDIWLPYFVASRTLRDGVLLREALSFFCVAGLIVALIATFESVKGWLLYESLGGIYGMTADPWVYLTRGAGGPLRAKVSLGSAIAVGLVLAITMILTLALIRNLVKWPTKQVAILSNIAGLVSSFSRGPWLGAAIGFFVYSILGKGGTRRIVKVAAGSIVIALVFASTQVGQRAFEYLPFVGTVESDTIDYRHQLIRVSLEVIRQKPVGGDINVHLNPIMEQMRQGQGIIDVTNTYLIFALKYGLVGLALFVGILVFATVSAWKLIDSDTSEDRADANALLRAVVGVMSCIAVTIATVSTVSVIPLISWFFVGICLAVSRPKEQSPPGGTNAWSRKAVIRTLVRQESASPRRIGGRVWRSRGRVSETNRTSSERVDGP